MSEAVQLKDRDFVVLIDSSGSMSTADQKGGKSRWEAAAETTIALASKAAKYDPDGISLFTFSGRPRNHGNVSDSQKVSQVFNEVEPNGSTNLDAALNEVFNDYQTRKKDGKTKPNGEILVVITDGEPDDRKAAKAAIISHSKTLDRDEEYGVLFVQVGTDPRAEAFLKELDDELMGQGAKFDIVDTISMQDVGNRTLTEVLAGAIAD